MGVVEVAMGAGPRGSGDGDDDVLDSVNDDGVFDRMKDIVISFSDQKKKIIRAGTGNSWFTVNG